MINGLYSASSGMFTQQTRLDVIASNIANASVPGFKGERIVFASFPDRKRIEAERPGAEPRLIGPLGGGATVDEITTNFEPGQTVWTGQDTDLMIFGEGFFHVETPMGERLTRNGAFLRDSEGILRNSDGNPLLGMNGPIQIPEAKFDVNGDGEIFVQRESPTPEGRRVTQAVKIDQLKLTTVPNLRTLERQGNSLYYRTSPEEQSVERGSARVSQGYLEMSNVKAIEESIQLIDTFRAYEAAQRLVQAMDSTLDQAINQVGRR